MLDRFNVSNFKSLMNVHFEPAGVNLLVGANNAGKTNLCHALRFVGLTSRLPLDDAARHCTAEPWNLLNVYGEGDTLSVEVQCTLTSEEETLRFTYSLCVAGRRNPGSTSFTRPFVLASESLRVTGGRFSDTVLLGNRNGSVRLLHEKRFVEGQTTGPAYVETTAPTDTTMLLRLYDLETNRRANLFKRYLTSWGYYSLDPAQLRSNAATLMDRVLEPTGSNLCSVLNTLHNERPREERNVIEAARLIEPRLDFISFHCPDPEHVYMFFEDREGHRFGVQNLSDGTLRFLAICYLVIAGRRENAAQPAPPVIMIEEPENGIYVGHLKPLFERLDPSGAMGQFIFSSHNPYFIDLFDGTLEGVHVVKAGAKYSEVRKVDPVRVKGLLGRFSLGDMHFRGLLE